MQLTDGQAIGYALLAGIYSALLMVWAHSYNGHLIPLWLIASAWHGLKRAGRYLMAVGASRPVGISGRSTAEIVERYSGGRF